MGQNHHGCVDSIRHIVSRTSDDAVKRVILVHGTWGRRSSWTDPDELMSRTIKSNIKNVEIEKFTWSGHNTHRARTEAALALADRINSMGDANVVIVAHSHGGNVALAAIRLARPSPHSRSLVALGTPFLTAGRPVEDLTIMAVTLGSAYVLIVGLAVIGVVESPLLLTTLSCYVGLHVVANLYSIVNRRWVAQNALDAMTAYRSPPWSVGSISWYRYWLSPSRFSKDPRVEWREERITRPGNLVSQSPHTLLNVDVPTEVFAFATDEAGTGLAAGQFLGLISGWATRVLGQIPGRAAAFSLAGAVFLLLSLIVMAFIVSEELQGITDRYPTIADWSLGGNPFFDLIDEVVRKVPDQVPVELRDLVRLALKVFLVAYVGLLLVYALIVPLSLIILGALFAVLLVEALAVGFDGACFIWTGRITTVQAPIGRSRLTLLPVSAIAERPPDWGDLGRIRRSLAHGSLTLSSEAVLEVTNTVRRMLKRQ